MKNTERYLALIFAGIIAFSATAQEFAVGILGSVSTGPVKISDIGNAFTDEMKGKNVYGYEGGLYFKIMEDRFYLKPQLLYSAREGELEYLQSDPEIFSGIKRTADFKIESFEAPVLLGWTIIDPQLSVEAGPVYNYIVIMTEDYNGYPLELAKNGFAYRVGLASEIGPVIIQGGFQGLTHRGGLSRGTEKASYREPYRLFLGLGLILGSTQ